MQLPLNLDPETPFGAAPPAVPSHVVPTHLAPAQHAPTHLAAPELLFVRHPRARRYVIRVTDAGTVRVTVPRWGSKRAAAAFAAEQRVWIDQQLRLRAERERREQERRLSSGESAPTLEERRALERASIARAKRDLPPRLLELAERHGLSVRRISIRNQRCRWGSCSRTGHICLNWRLVTMPADVRDYVLIHELMHLKRMDHSPKFWKLVAAACPEYKKARAWLRHQARVPDL